MEEGYYTCLVDLPLYEGPGEHEHQELILMLEGRKKLALFFDALPSRKFLNEEHFDPYVSSGRFIKFEKVINSGEYDFTYVLYALPGEDWRIDEYWQVVGDGYSSSDDDFADREFRIGELLGYRRENTQRFIDLMREVRNSKREISAS